MTHGDRHEQGHIGDDAPSWNAAYEGKAKIWSGQPNTQLMTEVLPLSPGAALDVGCGEGADAVWLAKQGWHVTAVDISSVALIRAQAHAESAGVIVHFEEQDLVSTPPSPASYDLVSAQFFHLADPERSGFMRGLGDAVRSGGQLLVVGHQPSATLNPALRDRLFSPDEITALFSPDEWVTEVSESRARRGLHHGEVADLIDAVVRLRRCD